MTVKKKVLVIDDSAVARQVLTALINRHPGLEVVGTAADPFIARDKIKLLNPDVLTLDVEMPRMDGHQFLRNLMRLRPMPVVMVSSLTEKGAVASLLALELGAIDCIGKPSTDCGDALANFGEEIGEKLIAAAGIEKEQLRQTREKENRPLFCSVEAKHPRAKSLLALGASTGGTKALEHVLHGLPENSPGTVIVQHIPGSFSEALARKLDQNSCLIVREAVDGEPILQGHAYLAPGEQHLEVVRDGLFFNCRLLDTEPVSRHRPSVDVLFNSVAYSAANRAIGVILTGMGKDGSSGLLNIRNSGCPTIAQDEESSVVWGMPGSAVAIGAVDTVLPLSSIPEQIRALTEKMAT
ncbi:chemotaxis response regulator protein-glutamate methylesterase [Chromatiales bacterium (ex Bugula neritina AB1)]|nr:chemotaxis response regulator protein-glutamate methylesterase [Chromatiales bacterium (ex Bugula neritina AB1)]